jgi:hypothetical protein
VPRNVIGTVLLTLRNYYDRFTSEGDLDAKTSKNT